MQSQSIEILIKYTHPSAYDFHPYATQWLLVNDTEKEMFIQLSEDDSHPQWERMGDVLETAFFDFMGNKEFMDECLRLYKYKKEDPLIKITQIIKEQQR
jgi:hypothetical protein